jgi:hypothetical protein
VDKVLVQVVAKLHRLDGMDAFWYVLDIQRWVYPYDTKGRRCDYSDIPKSVDKLEDDVWRSLAGAVQAAGGYAKETTAFAEFVWADFLRRRLSLKKVQNDFDAVLPAAIKLAKSNDAEYLPGWCGQRR